ncbi:hypothetical protein T01_7116 [Trichinella spiralis]|uniref:Uncharacterized protein n=1 Tax=Trichinella spiralis TaxID=6334 RepID=A0A0V0Z4Q4_TRISP|nr:hypothetical protein T01_7116 [Trichinella spiralis]
MILNVSQKLEYLPQLVRLSLQIFHVPEKMLLEPGKLFTYTYGSWYRIALP